MSSITLSQVLSLIFLAYVIAIVSAEVNALITAITFTRKYTGAGKNRQKLFMLRYFFCSALFHEKFAAMRHVKPTYCTFGAIMLCLVTAGVGVLVTQIKGAEHLSEFFGAGCIVGGMYFTQMYGKAFYAHRALVAKVTAKGNPLLFA